MASEFELGDLPQTPPRLKRPPSYSDSYYVLGAARTPNADSFPSLASINSPVPIEQTHPVASAVPGPRIHLFFIKSAIHVFFISIFETIFFFYYVSVTENAGILSTIDTYYKPFINTCPNWSPAAKEFLLALLTANQTIQHIEQKGEAGLAARNAANLRLLEQSLGASGFCLGIVVLGSLWLKVKDIPVRWWVVYLENISMVVLLGLYEYFFFRVIIYNYGTLSTPELNEHLVKGVYDCIQ